MSGWGLINLALAVAATLLSAPGVVSGPTWGSEDIGRCYLPGFRNVSAHISASDPTTFQADCKATEFTYNTETFSGDGTDCTNDEAGLVGHWHVYDASCKPTWGSFQGQLCSKDGFRQYSASLDLSQIAGGVDSDQALAWCKAMPADITGPDNKVREFYAPDRCVEQGGSIEGQFDVPDDSCCGGDDKTEPGYDDATLSSGNASRKLLINYRLSWLPRRCRGRGGDPYGPDGGLPDAATVLAALGSSDRLQDTVANAALYAGQLALGPDSAQRAINTRLVRFAPERQHGPQTFLFDPAPQTDDSLAERHPEYFDSLSDVFLARWIPVTQARDIWTTALSDDINDPLVIPAANYHTFRGNTRDGDLILTECLSGCVLVWAYDADTDTLYVIHINPNQDNVNAWAQDGGNLAYEITRRGRFENIAFGPRAFGRTAINGYGASDVAAGSLFFTRINGAWQLVNQVLDASFGLPGAPLYQGAAAVQNERIYALDAPPAAVAAADPNPRPLPEPDTPSTTPEPEVQDRFGAEPILDLLSQQLGNGQQLPDGITLPDAQLDQDDGPLGLFIPTANNPQNIAKRDGSQLGNCRVDGSYMVNCNPLGFWNTSNTPASECVLFAECNNPGQGMVVSWTNAFWWCDDIAEAPGHVISAHCGPNPDCSVGQACSADAQCCDGATCKSTMTGTKSCQ